MHSVREGSSEALHGRGAGFSLMEVVVATVLVATVLIIIVGLIPFSSTALKQSEILQAATLYGMQCVEEVSRKDFRVTSSGRQIYEVDQQNWKFRIDRGLYVQDNHPPDVACKLYDVVVHVSWGDPRPSPVELKIRVYQP